MLKLHQRAHEFLKDRSLFARGVAARTYFSQPKNWPELQVKASFYPGEVKRVIRETKDPEMLADRWTHRPGNLSNLSCIRF